MSDPMAEIRASFFVECEELLENLFDALQLMTEGQSDAETINIAFRAVHSIKGGAGAFALDDLVNFAHHLETVMDDVRGNRLAVSEDLLELFFRCGDVLSDLVRSARDGVETDRDVIEPVIDLLRSAAATGPSDTDAVAPPSGGDPDFQPLTLDLGGLDFDFGDRPLQSEETFDDAGPLSADEGRPGCLVVRFRPEPELYETGNEPLYLLRNLADLGPCKTHLDYLPPETSGEKNDRGRVTWTVEVRTSARRHAVEEIFEFANGLCLLEVGDGSTPPDANAVGLEAPAAMTPDGDSPREAEELAAPPKGEDPVANAPLASPASTQKAANPPSNPTVRVDLDRIDRLVNLVGELVINQSMLSQSVIEAQISSNSAVSNGLDEFLQLTRDIQESVMMIRAQPVKSLFQRMSRIVREASAAVGKKVVLVTDGETTEIDKTVIERLADPLTHMIRNAVDHGLESTEARIAKGKSETGKVRLVALHRSGRVVIEISDDGAGINRPKVRQIAVDKGLIPADASLTDAEIDQLLFLPGFSTADQISNLSGRGVGMDVVKNAIASLGGRIAIQSVPGEGTTFSISLPLTLAVLDGMVVTVQGETLVMPLNAIVETLTLKESDIRRLGAQTSVVLVRSEFVPLLDLGVELGYRPPLSDYSRTIALLVGQEDGQKAALVVDAIEDQRQVVIKGLQESYGRVSGVAAATILGDGQIALILDTADLVQNAVGRSRLPALREVS